MLTAFFRIQRSEKLAYKTLQQITNDVISELGLVAGSGVQTYTEPQAATAVNRMFDYLVGKDEWDHLITWDRYTLDGVTGTVVGAVTGIRDVDDVLEVRPLARRSNISRPIGTQHLEVQGNDAMYWTPIAWNAPNADKLMQFWPKTATGTVDIRSYKRPEPFVARNDIVPFNPLVITLGAAWYVLQGDGINAANAEKVQIMFDLVYQDLRSRKNKLEIGHGVGYRDDIIRVRQ